MSEKNNDAVGGGFFLAFSVLMLIQSVRIRTNSISEYGGRFMPTAISLIMMGLSALLVVVSLLKRRAVPSNAVQQDVVAVHGAAKRRPSHRSFLGLVAVTFAYLLLWEPLGFILATIPTMFGVMFILSGYARRSVPLFAGISVAFSAGTYLVFRMVFNLFLPPGILG